MKIRFARNGKNLMESITKHGVEERSQMADKADWQGQHVSLRPDCDHPKPQSPS